MKPIKKLEGKTIAIVGMGKSWFDYNLAKSHGSHFDEVWAINSVASVIYHDRVFMLDPASRFLDTDDAGGQTPSCPRRCFPVRPGECRGRMPTGESDWKELCRPTPLP